MNLDKRYWSKRYQEDQIGWDIGYISPPIKDYFNSGISKKSSILIPGGGNSYEAEYLWNAGYENVYVIDLAEEPLSNLKSRVQNFPQDQLFCGDFFEHEGRYDYIVEQTFFCALNPEHRSLYVSKMLSLLKPGGKLIGLLFDFPLTEEGPPFGGSKNEYLNLFEDGFIVHQISRATNSIKPRLGKEFFIELEKKL